jgi:glycosyltransferase involved in cell wall biosynthesis
VATCVGHSRSGAFDAELFFGPTYGAEGSLVEDARRQGLVLRKIPTLLREVNPLADPCALAHLTYAFARGRYDVVHTHSSKAGILGRVAARAARVPIVVHTVHGWGFNDEGASLQPAFVRAERWCAPLADALIAVSEDAVTEALRRGVGRPEQYTVIRSGVDLTRFARPTGSTRRLREELGIPETARIVGSVMRLSPPKDPMGLVDLLAGVIARIPDVVLVIVGEGPMRAALEDHVATRRLSDRVYLPGLRSDVPEFLALFEVFVFSSGFEGLPRVVPQAMAAGLPVVATDVGGIREAVIDGGTGYLVAPGDREALVARTAELLIDGDRARTMGTAGRAHATRFDARTMIAEIEALYHRLLAEGY